MTSVRRAWTLAGLAMVSWVDVLLELIAFALLCVGLVFFFSPAIEIARVRSRRTRELVGRWAGREIPSPYRPAPPEPERERDGWYRDGTQLYPRVVDPLEPTFHVDHGGSGDRPGVRLAAAEPAGRAGFRGVFASRRTGRAARVRPVD